MSTKQYPLTLPYIYLALADAAHYPNPVNHVEENYSPNLAKQIKILEQNSCRGWSYILFSVNIIDKTSCKCFDSLVVAVRGSDLSSHPIEILQDLYDEIGNAANKPVVQKMTKRVSMWLDRYYDPLQYQEVSFVGHSEGKSS